MWNVLGLIIVISLVVVLVLNAIYLIYLSIIKYKFKFIVDYEDREFVRNIKNNKYGYKLVEHTYKGWFDDEDMKTTYIANDFGLHIKFINDGISEIIVYIDEILVFEQNGWVHFVPRKMRNYLYNQLKYLKLEQKLDSERQKSNTSKTYEEEKRYLINKFNQA